MPINFADPAFFNVMRATKGHTASTYLITLAALTHGLDVTFFRNQREASLRNPLFSDAVSEPIFFRVSNGRRAHFFNGSQSDRTSATAAFTTRDKLKTKALLHAKNLNTPVGGLMSAKDHSLLSRMHQAGVKWFVIKPVAGSLGKGVFLRQSAAQVFRYLQANPTESFLVEQHIVGVEHRVFVVDGVAVSSYQAVPNHVVGNGTDDVRTLFAARQDQRKRNPLLVERPADMASVEMALVARGLTWSTVPTQGQMVWSASSGVPTIQSDFVLSFATLPEKAKRLAVAATKVVAAYNAALDMVLEPSGDAYVLEMNIRAMIAPASFPQPTGPYNLTVPNTLIQSLFGPPNGEPRPLLGFDFQSLSAELFREGRVSMGVHAADFAKFG